MASLSIRMLSVVMFAALLMNITNYLYIRVYHPSRLISYRYPKTVSGAEVHYPTISALSSKVQSGGLDKASSVSDQGNDAYRDTETTHSGDYEILRKTKVKEKITEYCPELPPGLGPEVEDRTLAIQKPSSETRDVKPGGIYQPETCVSLQSVAIVVAYRGSRIIISKWLKILHPFLIKQQLDYQIFVVEQSNTSQPYNRGKLLNVGFSEALRSRKNGFHCIVIHEPHIVPMDSRNLYRCSWYPRQLATSVETPIKTSTYYKPLLGGAIAISPEQFLKVNGFSNAYWGNDADYFDLYHRFNSSNYIIENSYPLVGKYKMIGNGLPLWEKSEYLSTQSPLYLLDGLTSLSYNVESIKLKRWYTFLKVNIDTFPGLLYLDEIKTQTTKNK